VVDGGSGRIVAQTGRPHGMIEDLAGKREQRPEDWLKAARAAMKSALSAIGTDRKCVKGIGVSGQQHGFVPLDGDGKVIRPAKLWCDTSTQKQCDEIIGKLGGLKRFTASKVLWLTQTEPANYARLRTILLPHNYINLWLTGENKMEFGDASGTAMLDVRRRKWSCEVLEAIDRKADWTGLLPPLQESGEICGELRPELAQEFGLPGGVIVSTGGGDNMMSAIGTGCVRPGVVTTSLGTSGTIYAYSAKPVVDPRGELAAFCDSTGGWLPLVCTMNATVATELVKGAFRMSNDGLAKAVAGVAPGSDGLVVLPYFQGERTPNLPGASGVYFGLNPLNFDRAHMARAAMEGATFGLRYGLDVLRRCGINARQIRLTGGGAKSAEWSQMVADVFETPVVCLKADETAALGGAIQAMWANANLASRANIWDIVDRCVRTDPSRSFDPRPSAAKTYSRLYEFHVRLAASLSGLFTGRG
jgi:xylulokinase